jgi:undecaprenyl-diphosphatase
MELLIILKAFLLGIVEGLTEFLPVSSTGHLIIVGDLINFNGDRAKTFEIFIQLGSIFGVMWFYRSRLTTLATSMKQASSQHFAINLFIAFLPAAIVGLLFHKHIKAYLFDPKVVAGALIFGGVLILIIERFAQKPKIEDVDKLSYLDALKVGIAQTAALFPGISRSGATIMGGLLGGLSRKTATEFSFFLAMPTMFAATLYDLYNNIHLLDRNDIVIFATGFIMAFFVALIVVKLFLAYVAKHNFTAFAYYRIIFGSLVLIYFW